MARYFAVDPGYVLAERTSYSANADPINEHEYQDPKAIAANMSPGNGDQA